MENVCRTCLSIIENSSSITYLNRSGKSPNAVSVRQKLKACIPQLTLEIVADPAICLECTENLHIAYQFRSTCLQTEKTLYNCIKKRKKYNPGFLDFLRIRDLLDIAREGIKDEHSYSYVERPAQADSSLEESTDDQESQSVPLSNSVESSLESIGKKVPSKKKQDKSSEVVPLSVKKSPRKEAVEEANKKKASKSIENVSEAPNPIAKGSLKRVIVKEISTKQSNTTVENVIGTRKTVANASKSPRNEDVTQKHIVDTIWIKVNESPEREVVTELLSTDKKKTNKSSKNVASTTPKSTSLNLRKSLRRESVKEVTTTSKRRSGQNVLSPTASLTSLNSPKSPRGETIKDLADKKRSNILKPTANSTPLILKRGKKREIVEEGPSTNKTLDVSNADVSGSPKSIATALNANKSPRKYVNKNKLSNIEDVKAIPTVAKISPKSRDITTIENVAKQVSVSPIKKSINRIIKKLKNHADNDCGTIIDSGLDVIGVSTDKSDKSRKDRNNKMPKIRLSSSVQKSEDVKPNNDQVPNGNVKINPRKRRKVSPVITRQVNFKRTCRQQNRYPVTVTKEEVTSEDYYNAEISPVTQHHSEEVASDVESATVSIQNIKEENSLRYHCNRCNKDYKFKSQYEVHLKSHIIKKLFACPICKKEFAQEKYLETHAMLHTNTGSYQCNLCLRYLSSSTALKRHIVTHTGEKAFKCPHCDKRFAQRVQCTVHMRTHTGDRPFLCNVCDSTFTQKSHLMGHMLIHTGEKPFKCDICPKEFRKINALRIHKNSHKNKPHQCRSCSFLFRDAETLRKHIEKHVTGRLPMKNKFVVNKKSKQLLIDKLKDDVKKMDVSKSGLKKIAASTSGGATTCNVCLKSFFNAFSLSRHMKSHSN